MMERPIEHPNRDEIETAIRAAAGYLSRHIAPCGRFDYVYDPVRDRVSRRYNLLRHAGATMVLWRVAGSRFDDGTAGQSAANASSYLRQFLIPAPWDEQTCFCLADGRTAKLGGAALALLALATRLERAPSNQDDVQMVRALGRYLVSQQKPDGRFVSKLDLVTRAELPFDSAYYPGEAVLALCAAYRVTGDVVFLERADCGIRYLARSHLATPPTPTGFADHWAMMALAALNKIQPGRWYVEHLRYLVNPLLIAAENGAESWLDDQNTTPISTRVEGLVAAFDEQQSLNERAYTQRLLQTILTGLARCYERQVGSRRMSTLSESLGGRGGFVRSVAQPSIRIDYVQHALAASLGAIESLP